MKLNLDVTNVFDKNWAEYEKKTRNVVNQGGSRSSKTYSIAQLFMIVLFTTNNTVLSVCRKTLPALRVTAMRDFFDIMKDSGVYREENFNKTELIYKYRTNEIEFFSVDQPQKVRGRKRKLLWLNEANEFSKEDYRQLNMRTTGQIFYDYNPSDEFHWIYDDILTRDDTTFIKSTYRDNVFLEPEIVREIERYRLVDKNYWNIYGLGERGVSELKVYNHWQLIDDLPEGEVIYGLDFGYNHQTALVKIVLKDNNIYAKELLYETGLDDSDRLDKLKQLGIPKNAYIYADSEAPDSINYLKKAGYNVKPASKEKNSVFYGINLIKSRQFYITKDSVNLQKEARTYSWKEKDGKPLDEPVKENDHLMDAIRYAVYTYYKKPKPNIYV